MLLNLNISTVQTNVYTELSPQKFEILKLKFFQNGKTLKFLFVEIQKTLIR